MVALREQMNPPKFMRYNSIEQFILKEGQEYRYEDRPAYIPKMPDKQCYQNAFKLIQDQSSLTYVEGFATAIIPIAHAWCVDSKGVVIDPTWQDGRDYIGVPLPFNLVMHVTFIRGVYGVIDDWENQWPILRLGLDKIVKGLKTGKFHAIYRETE